MSCTLSCPSASAIYRYFVDMGQNVFIEIEQEATLQPGHYVVAGPGPLCQQRRLAIVGGGGREQHRQTS